jgi:hypothetical protein
MVVGNGEYRTALHEFFGLTPGDSREIRAVRASNPSAGGAADVGAAALAHKIP